MSKRLNIPCGELRQLYEEQGLTTIVLSQRYGCSVTTIANHLRRCGVSLRNARFQARTVPTEELLQLYAIEQKPLWYIARHFEVSISTIYNKLNAIDAPKRRSRRLRERRSVGYRVRRSPPQRRSLSLSM